MQTRLTVEYQSSRAGQRAEEILRACVHCGFCNATCPTYQLLADELDGPRGRIYLIKQIFEGQSVSQSSQQHLDRCLSCRSCETTCPSGVRYSELLELGRTELEKKFQRPWYEQGMRWLLRKILPYSSRVRRLYQWLPLLRVIVPPKIRAAMPTVALAENSESCWPAVRHARRMLILDGCVQEALRADINLRAARVLDALGISLIRVAGCCGAVSQHLDAPAEARGFIRQNIARWQPWQDDGVEAILSTSSACSLMMKDYQRLLPAKVGDKARLPVRDISEVIAGEDLSAWSLADKDQAEIAFHAPCTLQHGLGQPGLVEGILEGMGFVLKPVSESHLCCGAAGTYSLLQPELSQALLARKLAALTAAEPLQLATANIGCLLHLAEAADRPVVHWLQLLERCLPVAERHDFHLHPTK